MKYSVVLNDQIYSVEIREEEGIRRIYWEDKPVDVEGNLGHSNSHASILIEGQPVEASWKRQGSAFDIDIGLHSFKVEISRGGMRGGRAAALKHKTKDEVVSAPMPGLVVAVKVEPDQEVKMGEPLLILEAMKMENELRSPVNGRVQKIEVNPGNKVEKGERLIVLQK